MAHDRRTKWVAMALAVVALAVGMVTLVYVLRSAPKLDNTEKNTAIVRQGNELAACRSIYRSDLDDAYSVNQVLILRGLSAAALGDDQQMHEILPFAVAQVDATKKASDLYAEAVQLSLDNPKVFLAKCHANPRENP